jgi:hypothetical protein
MKKLIAIILLFSLNSYADCDWSLGITPGPNKTFVYSEACHQEVGRLVQANKDLTSAIQLKDLALQNSDSRVLLWQKNSADELDRLTKIEATQKNNNWLYFGLGCLTVIGAGFMTARLIGK